MRGSAAFRAAVAPGGVLAGPWVKNELWRRARAVPSLDLRFADDKSLTNAVTGQSLVTFTRASSGTYVGSDGLIKTATTNLLLRSEEFDDAYWSKANATITANSIAAPTGATTADSLIETAATGQHRVFRTITGTTNTNPHTVSFFAKANTRTRVYVGLAEGTTFSRQGNAVFNLSAGTVVSVSGGSNGATGGSATIQNFGNGWYRCTYTLTFGGTDTTAFTDINLVNTGTTISYTGDGTSGIYIWGAQLEQSSTVGEYIPTTSVINSAPRFDHNPTTGESLGLLVEEQRTNSIRNNTMVGAVAGTPGTIPTNWDIAITGSGITREIVGVGIEDGITYIDIRYFGTGSGSVIPQIRPETTTQIVAAVGQAWTASYYLKVAAGSTAGAFGFSQIWQERDAVGVALNTVTVAIPEPTTAALGTQRNVLTRTLTNAGTARLTNRLQFSFTDGVAIDITLRIGLPQLEQGAFATSVIPTTTAAATRAADVASITGSNFGTTRTNLLLRSEAIATSPWFTGANTTLTNNTSEVLDPAGGSTATKVLVSGGTGAFGQGATLTAAIHTGSIWLRCSTGTISASLIVYLSGSPFTNIGTANVTITTFWQRFTVVTSTATAAAYNLQLNNIAVGTVYAWGAQLEVGSAVTPYIPTTTAAVSVFESSWYRQDEGTVFVSALTNQTHGGSNGFPRKLTISDGTISNLIEQFYRVLSSYTDTGYIINSLGVSQAAFDSNNQRNGQIATIGYASNNFALVVGGSAIDTDTLGTVPTVNQLILGARPGSNNLLNGTISRLTYWPQRLPNSTLEAITR